MARMLAAVFCLVVLEVAAYAVQPPGVIVEQLELTTSPLSLVHTFDECSTDMMHGLYVMERARPESGRLLTDSMKPLQAHVNAQERYVVVTRGLTSNTSDAVAFEVRGNVIEPLFSGMEAETEEAFTGRMWDVLEKRTGETYDHTYVDFIAFARDGRYVIMELRGRGPHNRIQTTMAFDLENKQPILNATLDLAEIERGRH